MTLVLVGSIDSETCLAADRRVFSGPPGGPYTPGEDDKLFLIGSCSVASFGNSPLDMHVPTFINAFPKIERSPKDLATAIYQAICALPDRGDFGLLVLGSGAQTLELWEVQSKIGIASIELNPGTIFCRARNRSPAPIPPNSSREILVGQMHSVFREVAQDDEGVGPPYEFSVLQFGKPPIYARGEA